MMILKVAYFFGTTLYSQAF